MNRRGFLGWCATAIVGATLAYCDLKILDKPKPVHILRLTSLKPGDRVCVAESRPNGGYKELGHAEYSGSSTVEIPLPAQTDEVFISYQNYLQPYEPGYVYTDYGCRPPAMGLVHSSDRDVRVRVPEGQPAPFSVYRDKGAGLCKDKTILRSRRAEVSL